MAPVLDETARDLPVRDVGLMRGGLMPAATESDVKPWKKHQTMRIKADPQRLFRFPREHLEDLCLRLQEENNVLRQHTRTQEHRLRRMSNRLVRLRQAQSGSGAAKERDMEDTLQELEARVVTLESQKGVLQNKLSLARQHILDLGGRSTHKYRGKSMEVEGGVRRAAQTAPARYGPTLEDTRVEIERFRSSVAEQMRAAELELTAQALRDTLRDKEREIEGTMREMKKQQADRHRITIRENVDLIRLQKQLSDKSTALRVTQERFNDLQEVYEKQLEESQRSLKESHEALLGKVELLSEQLKQERQRALTVEGELTSATLTLQSLDKLHERISDLEGERDLIKESYDSLLESTLTTQSNNKDEAEGSVGPQQNTEEAEESALGSEVMLLQGMLRIEREERSRLEQERERLRGDKEILEEQRQRDRDLSVMMRERQECLEQEVSRYKEQISALQERLDSVSKEFDMSVEELSETLVQIKAFRMQQESREGLSFLRLDGNADDPSVNTQALHAETALELQKTRKLLLVEHRISKERQEELNAVNQRIAREREEVRTRMAEKDKLLLKRAQQINTLQAQLKEFTNSSGDYRRSIPVQYTWPAGDQEVVPPLEEDVPFSQLRAGESLLEIHIKAATFTPGGLRRLGSLQAGEDGADNVVTFCTYGLLDFEVHSTPVVSGSQPNYGFTSRYALTPRDLGRLGGQGSGVRVELHQALGGVRFMTHGSGLMSLLGAMDRRGERITGLVNITGAEGEIVGAVDFWVRLFPPAERVEIAERPSDKRTVTQRCPVPVSLGWQDTSQEEIHDYGGGIPNELVLVLERCVGLSARWPGLLPDPYLTCRFYDLPPHVSHTVQCSADPVFNDTASYPLAVTSDVMNYLRSSSLWVYVYDDSDDQMPPAYLAKTPVPLQALASGREIRGDYVLRDPAGGPRGMVRVMLKWKYPFQPPVETLPRRAERGGDRRGAALMDSSEREERSGRDTEPSQRPIAKPRAKLFEPGDVKAVQRDTKAWPQPPSDKQRRSQTLKTQHVSSGKAPSARQATDRKRSARRSPDRWGERPPGRAEPKLSAKPHLLTTKLSGEESSRQSLASLSRKSSASDTRTQDLPSLDQVSMDEEEEVEEEESESAAAEHSEAQESSVSSSSQSDIIVIPRKRKTKRGDKLRVEILSLTFEPSSHVALDKSVQRVYVEYRLLGVPMETTETPMSLRKPRRGEEIHYNFMRVIYVDGSQSAPLRQYLYTMLEGSDPNQGRLKFTVVSEPMDDDEECVDVGHAFLDLQELLLTGNDVFERQIDIVSVDEDKEVIGNLKVSLEAAKALSGIYREFHQEADTKTEDESDDEEEEEEEEEDEEEEEEKEEEEHKEQRSKEQIHEIEYDNDSDFF